MDTTGGPHHTARCARRLYGGEALCRIDADKVCHLSIGVFDICRRHFEVEFEYLAIAYPRHTDADKGVFLCRRLPYRAQVVEVGVSPLQGAEESRHLAAPV